MIPKIKITKSKSTTPSGTGKQKNVSVQVGTKKGINTYSRTVTRDGEKKSTETRVNKNLRTANSVTKTKENGVKSKSYYANSDRSGSQYYRGADKKNYQEVKKANNANEKSSRAIDRKAQQIGNALAKEAGKAGAKIASKRVNTYEKSKTPIKVNMVEKSKTPIKKK